MVIISNFVAPESGVLHHEPGCQLIVDDQQVGTGDLYITESSVLWADSPAGRCVTLAYRKIALHAVQRVPTPLIYMMLDYKFSLPELIGDQAEEMDEDDFDPNDASTEVKFVPQNEASLTAMYEALNTGQGLHPDTEQSDSEDDVMVADDINADGDPAARMENLTIENTNGNGAVSDEDEEEDQFADA